MNAEYRVHSLGLEIDFLEEPVFAKIVASDSGWSRRIPIDAAKTAANPIHILPQARVANARKSDPGAIGMWQDAPAPSERSIRVGSAHKVQVEAFLFPRCRIETQNTAIYGREIYVVPVDITVMHRVFA
jgi:hypothetical protein